MAITFRHDAAAGLIGSFAAGQAAAGRRRQKYSMALLLQDRRQRQRLAELGFRRGVRGRVLAPPGGRIDDPLADDDALDAAHRRRLAAARRARARKGRLGIDIPFESQRDFIPQADIDLAREQKREDELLRDKLQREDRIREEERGQKLADVEQKQQQDLRKEERTFTRKTLEDPRFSDEQRTAGNELLRERGLLRGSERLSAHDEAEAQMELQELDRKLQEILDNPEGVAALTPIEQARENTVMYDPDKKDFVPREEAGPNAYPVPIKDGQPDFRNAQVPDDGSAARSLRAKSRTARKALNAAQEAQRERLADDVKPLEDEQRFLQKNVDIAQEAVDDIEEEMSPDEKYDKEVIERGGVNLQDLGPGKGFVEVAPGAAESAAKAAKETEDAIVKRVNELMDDEDYTGSEDDAYTAATKYVAREQRIRMRHQAGGQLPIDTEGLFKDVEPQAATVQPEPAAVTERVARTSRLRKGPAPAPAPTVEGPRREVRGDADYDKLEEGTEFIDAETGLRWRKPFKAKPGQAEPTFFDLMVR